MSGLLLRCLIMERRRLVSNGVSDLVGEGGKEVGFFFWEDERIFFIAFLIIFLFSLDGPNEIFLEERS